jgi:DNA methylase
MSGPATWSGGHQRLRALRKRKQKSAEVIVVDLPIEDEKALNLALNSPTIRGEFTSDLQAILEELGRDRPAVFEELNLGALLTELDGKTLGSRPDIDEVPPLPKNPTTKSGDVWTLGRHRLLCGDATSAADLERLLAGERATFAFTSPPYNAGKSANLSHNARLGSSKYVSFRDDQSSIDYLGFLRSFSDATLARTGCLCVNLQQIAGNKVALIDYLGAYRDHLIDIAIWDKGMGPPQMAKNVLTNRFEYLIFLSPETNPSRVIPTAAFTGKVENLYEGPPQRGNEFSQMHAATFPVHLPEWVLGTFTRDGATVLDPFGETGTTMIACESSHRRARLIEIDPSYVDLTVTRWEQLTGGEARRES